MWKERATYTIGWQWLPIHQLFQDVVSTRRINARYLHVSEAAAGVWPSEVLEGNHRGPQDSEVDRAKTSQCKEE